MEYRRFEYIYITEYFKHFHNNYHTILLLLVFEIFISPETRFIKEKKIKKGVS